MRGGERELKQDVIGITIKLRAGEGAEEKQRSRTALQTPARMTGRLAAREALGVRSLERRFRPGGPGRYARGRRSLRRGWRQKSGGPKTAARDSLDRNP